MALTAYPGTASYSLWSTPGGFVFASGRTWPTPMEASGTDARSAQNLFAMGEALTDRTNTLAWSVAALNAVDGTTAANGSYTYGVNTAPIYTDNAWYYTTSVNFGTACGLVFVNGCTAIGSINWLTALWTGEVQYGIDVMSVITPLTAIGWMTDGSTVNQTSTRTRTGHFAVTGDRPVNDLTWSSGSRNASKLPVPGNHPSGGVNFAYIDPNDNDVWIAVAGSYGGGAVGTVILLGAPTSDQLGNVLNAEVTIYCGDPAGFSTSPQAPLAIADGTINPSFTGTSAELATLLAGGGSTGVVVQLSQGNNGLGATFGAKPLELRFRYFDADEGNGLKWRLMGVYDPGGCVYAVTD